MADCDCGLWQADPLHDAFHRIKEHNEWVRQAARQRAMDEFEKRLKKQSKSQKR